MAVELFNKEKFVAAQKEFSRIINSEETNSLWLLTDAKYYHAICAVELQNKDAEYLLQNFIAAHFETSKINIAYFQLGRLYYRQKRYKKVTEALSKVDFAYLSKDELAEYYFKLGYSYMNISDYEKANKAFYEIKDIDTKYYLPTNYYYAHIAYTNRNYETALKSFSKIKNSEEYKYIVPVYICQIYYLQHKYDSLISSAVIFLQDFNYKQKDQNTLEMMRLLGEAYFRNSLYEEAAPHLKEYIRSSSKVSRTDIYQLAYVLYRANKYDQAIENFERVVDGQDSLAQEAFYYLGDCFIKVNKKQSARNAFLFAARIDFNKTIKEDAFYNYAKLTYELFSQSEAMNVFQQYADLFPNSSRTDEINEYLASIFLLTKNYTDALSAIEKIKFKSDKINLAYQRTAYYKGVELFNDAKLKLAIDYFNKSLLFPVDKKMAAKVIYWKSEAYYKLGNFDQAITHYKDFIYTSGAINLPIYNLANYNLGYAYFMKKDYSASLIWFRKYVSEKDNDSKRYSDALIRIADSFFMLKDYFNASDYYTKAIGSEALAADYAILQNATILGIQGRFKEKRELLQKLLDNYEKSAYSDDALYEIAKVNLLEGQYEAALSLFQRVTDEFPNSSYKIKALLGTALVHYNKEEDEKALQSYKQIVEEYSFTPEAKEALEGIKNIYIGNNNADAFLKYAEQFSFANITVAEQDSITYKALENKYFSNGSDCKKNIDEFDKYLQKFPSGYFVLNANFYKAECENKLGQFDHAIKGYEFVLNYPQNTFTEKSLLKLAAIYYNAKEYSKALEKYRRLEEVAEYKNNILEALAGEMRCNFLTGALEEAIIVVKKLIAEDKVSKELITEAHFIHGKSLLMFDSLSQALTEFETVVKSTNSEMSAESKYNIALIQYKQKEYANSQKTLFELINQEPSYDYWIAKGFILLADNYVVLGDEFQARHTLKSVIDNYEGDELKAIAQEKLNNFDVPKDKQQLQLIEEELQPFIDDTLSEIEN